MRLTGMQFLALNKYKLENGRNWKSKLQHAWETGGCVGELQQIRNNFGPTWLMNYNHKTERERHS